MRRRVSALAVVACAAAAFAACESRGDECPPGTRRDDSRARAVSALLATTREGQGLLARDARRDRPICFAAIDETVARDDGVIVLDDRASDRESAARLGHLLHHVIEGPPLDDRAGTTDCDARVETALAREATAYALELSLRRSLAVAAPRARYPFEPAPGEPLPPAESIASWLASHPDGGSGVPPLARAYRERCEAASRP